MRAGGTGSVAPALSCSPDLPVGECCFVSACGSSGRRGAGWCRAAPGGSPPQGCECARRARPWPRRCPTDSTWRILLSEALGLVDVVGGVGQVADDDVAADGAQAELDVGLALGGLTQGLQAGPDVAG